MKIAIINRHKEDTYGGSEVQCDIIARQLKNFGHEIIYLAMDGQEKYSASYTTIPVKTTTEITDVCKREHPDLVYWRFNKNHFLKTVRELSQFNIPIVFAGSNLNDLKRWKKAVINQDKSIIKKVIIHGLTGITHLRNHLGFRYVSGVVVNNEQFLDAVSNPVKTHIHSSVEDRAVKFTWERPYVLWVSSLKPIKRPEVCLEAALSLKEKGVDVLMIGPVQKKQYEYIQNHRSTPENLHYLGAKPNEVVNGAIKESICLIHTCRPEGFPNVFMQAWQYGKPVVSLEYDPDQLLEKKGLGLVSQNEITSFISNIERVIDDKELRDDMAEKAKLYTEQNLSPERNAKKLEEFFLQVLNKFDGS